MYTKILAGLLVTACTFTATAAPRPSEVKVQVTVIDLNSKTRPDGYWRTDEVNRGEEGVIFSETFRVPVGYQKDQSKAVMFESIKTKTDLGDAVYLGQNDQGNRLLLSPQPKDQALVGSLYSYKFGKRPYTRTTFEGKVVVFQGVEQVNTCGCTWKGDYLINDRFGRSYKPLFLDRDIKFSVTRKETQYVSGDFLIKAKIVK